MAHLTTLASVGMLILTTSAALAHDSWGHNPGKSGWGWGKGGSHGHVVGAPGPIAGVGLPVLAVAGGYVWIRRQRRKRLEKPSD